MLLYQVDIFTFQKGGTMPANLPDTLIASLEWEFWGHHTQRENDSVTMEFFVSASISVCTLFFRGKFKELASSLRKERGGMVGSIFKGGISFSSFLCRSCVVLLS